MLILCIFIFSFGKHHYKVKELMNDSGELKKYLVDTRRTLHQEPELAFHEEKTAELILRELNKLGIPYDYTGVGGGIIATIACKRPNRPSIALRAEMDALPGHETTGLSFSSRNIGNVHACGHDAHMAIVLGAAKLLKEKPVGINVFLFFQPAEESGGGSREIIKTGILEKTSAIFAGHVTHYYSVGQIMIGHGIITAQSDRFEINITGKGGHGARPQEATDAVIIAGSLVNSIQTLVSREVDPLHPSVVTIGQIQAGSAANVIAESAMLRGTIRTTLPESRERITQGLQRMVDAFEILHNAKVCLTITEGYPPVVNSNEEVNLALAAVKETLGDDGVIMMDYPSMGSEDFSYYLEKIPGCYVRFGARDKDKKFVPLHSPSFDIDEEVLAIGANYFHTLSKLAADYYV